MGILVELTRSFDNMQERKSEKEKIPVKVGQLLNIVEANIDCISVPVKCKSCGASNILIAEDFQQTASDTERGMGRETYHYGKANGSCERCKKDMIADINLCEYPEGTITFEDDFIKGEENCTYEKDVELK